MPSNSQSRLSGLVRVAIVFVFSRIRSGTRMVEMSAALALMLLVSAIVNIPALLLGQIVTKATDKPLVGFDIFPSIQHIKEFSDISPYLLLLGGLILAREVLTLGRKYLVERVATSIEAEEYFYVSKHVLSLDLGEMAKQRVGAVNVRIHRSIEGLVQFLKLSFMDFLPTVFIALFALITAVSQNLTVAAMMLTVALVGLFVTTIQIKSQQGVRRFLFEAKAELSANISEVLLGIDYVRASGMIVSETRRTKAFADNFREREFTHHKWMMSFDSIKQLVEGVGYVVVIGLSAWLASRKEIAFGQVLTFAMLYISFTTPLDDLHRIIDEGWEACLKIRELVDTYSKPADPGLQGSTKAIAATHVVSCSNVTVAYAPNEGSRFKALDCINFELTQGEVVGVAGPSGSGKSSLIRLLLGLTSNYSGNAKLFGVEVRDLDKKELATLTSYVPQTPFLVKGTITECRINNAMVSAKKGAVQIGSRSHAE